MRLGWGRHLEQGSTDPIQGKAQSNPGLHPPTLISLNWPIHGSTGHMGGAAAPVAELCADSTIMVSDRTRIGHSSILCTYFCILNFSCSCRANLGQSRICFSSSDRPVWLIWSGLGLGGQFRSWSQSIGMEKAVAGWSREGGGMEEGCSALLLHPPSPIGQGGTLVWIIWPGRSLRQGMQGSNFQLEFWIQDPRP